MRPGWYSNLKARELINLSAGVANVGIKAQTQIVMEQMKVEVVSAENVPRGRNQVQRSHRHRLFDGAAMIRRQNQHVPDSSYQCPRKTGLSRTSARWGRNSQHTPRPYSLLSNHIDVGKIHFPLYFLDKNQSVLSFKTCWWSEPTKKKSQSEQVTQKYNQTDGWRRKKMFKTQHFRIPQPLMKCNFSCSMLCCPSCKTSASAHDNRI